MTDSTSSLTEPPWHSPPAHLGRYARGKATPSQVASLEPHLAGCPSCQAAFVELTRSAPRSVEDRLSRVFDAVIDSVDRPVPSVLERLLMRVGVPDHVARLLVVTPAMRLSWFAAVATTLAFTVLATRSGGMGFGAFLVGAPLLPLGAVAATFAVLRDPTADLTITTPVRNSWLLLLRSVGVLVTTLVLCGTAAIALPDHGWENAAWLLPALALSTASAALSTWVHPSTAAVALSAGWLGALAATSGPVARLLRTVDSGGLVEQSAAFAPSGQLVALAITCVSSLVLLRRREVLDIGRLP